MLYEICERKSWTDNIQSKHFPKVHLGKPYQESGDSQTIITFLTVIKRIGSGDEDMDGCEAPVETALDLVQSDIEETYGEKLPALIC